MSRFIRRMLLCAVLLSGVSVVTPAVARADDQTAAAEQRQRAAADEWQRQRAEQERQAAE